MPLLRNAIVLCAAVGLTGCVGMDFGPELTEPVTLGRQSISTDALNAGREAYVHYCYACHGLAGDGQGPAAKGLRPAPRDLTKGIYKFAGVAAGDFPSDEDLLRIVRYGLGGTAMLQWDVPEQEARNIVQYVKWLGRARWTKARPLPPADAAIPADPFGRAGRSEAVERGNRLYHTTLQCYLCHPAYATAAELRAYGLAAIRTNAYEPEARDSADYRARLLPPDFTRHPMRSIRMGRVHIDPPMTDEQVEDRALKDFYRIIASGVPGTAMPSWAAMPPEDLWSVVHFVKSLADMKDTPGASELRERLLREPSLPPPPAAEP